MRECHCEKPAISPDPRDEGMCQRCLARPGEAWTSCDATMAEFYDRLEEAMFSLAERTAPVPSADLVAFREFRTQAEIRELAGRKTFGFKHLSRDNPREATEEVADASNYILFSLMDARRKGDAEEWSLALTAAKHAALAHKWALALRAHSYSGFSPS